MSGTASKTIVAATLVALTTGLLTVGSVTASSGDPAAAASKHRKCTKAAWKCAPKRYHLSARGVIQDSPDFVETWGAEVDLRKYRASSGEVDYSQAGGTVAMSASWTADFSDLLKTCETGVGYSVPQQKAKVPARGLNSTDFGLFFRLIGDDKNKVFLNAGYIQPEFSNIKGVGTASCLGGPGAATFEYFFLGSNESDAPSRGRPNGSTITGGGISPGNDSIEWTLTAKKSGK